MSTLDSTTPNTRIAQAKFTGQSGEFFKIWIVNLLLSILTLGIYSAWAKVHTNQYLHGHTKLEDHGFRYLATPLQILKGRLLAVSVFIVITILSSLTPMLALGMSLLILIATPWLIMQSIRFNMRMTSYRNIRFSFKGNYWEIVLNFLLLPMLALFFTLGIALPWVHQRIDKYIFDNLSVGGQPFKLNTDVGQYYVAALVAIAIMMAGIITIVIFAVGYGVVIAQAGDGAGEQLTNTLMGLIVLLYAGLLLLNFVAIAVSRGIVLKHIIGSLKIENVATFKTDMSLSGYIKLQLLNSLMLILSLGLAYPVTKIRTRRFVAQHIQVQLTEQADTLVNDVQGKDPAFGEEAAGFFDADLSFT
ncbi:YjgN family protein [Parashewanella tropica]|uniref:YjgN family protein n=1 Tax=Parashewanella tropica TaxID=2547970 RepID=UPI00105994FA|nr:YjgN family protein [Parashewanella tropica]